MILVIYDDLIDEAQLFVDNRYLIRLCMGKWANKKGIVVKMFCIFTSACWYFSVVKVKGEKDDGEKKSLYAFFYIIHKNYERELVSQECIKVGYLQKI